MSTFRETLRLTLATALLCASVAPASAAAIQLGTRIDVTATTFALPVEIVDGSAVISWTFDLAYDAADVQVHVGCDPLADLYCSLLTGPVTEGDYFAAGAPFNLLVPGFIELDAGSLEQIGRLSGVHGAYGGMAPLPSGDGVITYVLFTTLGTGNSPITVESGTVSQVPEPTSLALAALGLTALSRRRLRRTHPVSP